ncbi:RB1-inducible coiled-coil protein 1-like isoform X2 [Artemia franciscana]|uniref:RB1-inducible coiled-coil protein 1-like isoform X2 n=1 Tax=Artemia franciscana TaxID=6661 RepID=UPI0032DAD26B
MSLFGDLGLYEEIQKSEVLPDSIEAINVRCRVAQKIHDHCCDILQSIERLVKDQLLQQQGWMAAVANLEDCVTSFQKQFENVQSHLESYPSLRDEFDAAMQSVETALQNLDSVPLVPSLSSLSISDAASVDSGVDQTSSLERQKVSLLQWLDSKDPKNSYITQLYDYGLKLVVQLDQSLTDDQQVELVLRECDNNDMKHIKGITERLAKLEQWKDSAKKVLDSISGSLAALTSNQKRLLTVKDSTVLPELCNSHRKEITGMVQKMNQLLDMRLRLARAKAEMSVNLSQRLRWLIYTEKSISDVTNRVLIQQKALEKLRQYVQLVSQIHSAPKLYEEAIREVLRRRNFIKTYCKWKETTENALKTMEAGEIAVRQDIFDKLDGHFLSSIFKALAAPPPECQEVFLPQIPSGDKSDFNLPHIKEAEIVWLASQLNTNLNPILDIGIPLTFSADSEQKLSSIKEVVVGLKDAIAEIKHVIQDVKVSSCLDIKVACESLKAVVVATEISLASKCDYDYRDWLTYEKEMIADFVNEGNEKGLELLKRLSLIIKERNSIEENLKKLNEEMDVIKEAEERMNAELDKQKTELVMLKQENELLNKEKRDIFETTQKIKEENAALISNVNLLRQLNENITFEKRQMQERLASMETELNEVKDKLRGVKEENDKLNKANLDLENYKEAAKRFEKDNEEMASEKIEHLEKLKVSENKITSLIDQLHSEIQKVKDSDAEKQCLIDKVSTTENELKSLKILVKNLEEEKEEILRNKEQLNSVKVGLEAENAKSKEAYREAKDTWESHEKQIILVHELELEEVQSTSDEIIKALKKALEDKNNENRELAMKVEFLETQSKEAVTNQNLIDSLISKHRKEIELKESTLRDDYEQQINIMKHGIEAQIEKEKKSSIDMEKEQMLKDKDAKIEELNKTINGIKKDHEGIIADLRSTLEEEYLKGLETQRQNLSIQYRQELETQRLRFRMVTSKATSDLADPDLSRSLRTDPMTSSVILSSPSSPRLMRTASKEKPQKVTANEGSIVTVEYDPNRSAWFVVGNTDALHLVHTDCTSSLGDPAGQARVKITKKECCMVRKDGNRYNLPRGKQFFRIRVEKMNIQE